MKKLSFLFALFLSASMMASTVNDVLTNATFGISGTTYTDKSNVSATSDARYASNTAGDYNSIQMRSKNSNSGIVSTTSGGKLRSIQVTFNSNTAADRTLDIYAKNTAYSSPSDLYGSANQGTKVTSFTFSNGATQSYTFNTDYAYIGIRSNSNALYMDEIQIMWDVADSGDEEWYQLVGNGDADHGAWCGGLSWQDGESLVDYEIEYTNLPVGSYKFKLKWPGTWDGELNYSHVLAQCRSKVTGYDGGDVNFVMQQAGRVKIEVRSDDGINDSIYIEGDMFDSTTDTPDPVEWQLVGNGDDEHGAWCGGANWTSGVALEDDEIAYTNLPAGDYQFKLKAPDSWDVQLNYSHVMAECLNLVQPESAGVTTGNVCFVMEEVGDVRIEVRHFDEGDSIFIEGDMKLNSEIIVVDMGPIVETYFGTLPEWAQETESYAEWNELAQTVYVHINQDKNAQWLAQVKIDPNVVIDANKAYDVTFKLYPYQSVNGVTFKYQPYDNNDVAMIYQEGINLTAANEYTFTKTNVAGVEGVNTMIFDFGFASANSVVAIYGIEVKEAPERLFIAGNGQDDPNGVWCDGKNWDPAGTVLMNDSIHYDNLQPGIVYAFKVTGGAWGYHEMNYSNVLAECKANFVYTLSEHDYGNIQFQMAAAGAVDIVVKGDSIGVYGNFANPDAIVIDTYTMVGSKDIFGGDADYAILEANDMILQQDGSYKLELQNISLYVDERYVMKIFGNHSAMVYEYPEAGYYYYYDPQESGVYDITFWFYPENDEGYKFDSQFVIKSIFTAVDELNAEQAARKLIRDGQLFIVLPDGSRYTATGLRVE